MNLIKTGNSWKFATEADLEDFVWANLKELFGLIPLKRQYYVKGQICDILALNDKKRLVVLELKNGEDRYIVQQLTRYYEALLKNKPFQEEVNTNTCRVVFGKGKIINARSYFHIVL
ncbi:endonuclease NucS domain-containing protein [Nostoc sp.]|uniref:endonuclease NucS domain-containing protein n=1 Tax=Nostoc sp. TaxID=1180 RepID=UPI002FFABD8D